MSLDIIPKLSFPDVPNLPGVPLLARAALTTIVDVTSALNIARVFATQAPAKALFHATKAAPVWGVFTQAGAKAINPDNIMGFDYRAQFSVANFPVQQGQFASYNKVTHPFDTSVILTKGGSVGDRTAFLQACEAVSASLDLYNILTPEKTYLNCNVHRMEMSRKERNGAFFVVVELFFQQIQQVDAQYSTAGTQATSTANASVPNAVPVVNSGNVQAMPPTPQVQTAVISKLTTGM